MSAIVFVTVSSSVVNQIVNAIVIPNKPWRRYPGVQCLFNFFTHL
jgi:hypothetical protein